jgi:predicted RNase H-like nuclease (RuvC/YqgF family)
MPDKKPTDKEIVKAFKICNNLEDGYCSDCPYEYCDRCIREVARNTLDLINRLQVENERLNNAIDEQDIEIAQLYKRLDKAKAEAYKECIEKVKEEINKALYNNYDVKAERLSKKNIGETDEFISYCDGKIDCLRGIDDFLDNLLKELVGDKQCE